MPIGRLKINDRQNSEPAAPTATVNLYSTGTAPQVGQQQAKVGMEFGELKVRFGYGFERIGGDEMR
jgi:hypothetical protein